MVGFLFRLVVVLAVIGVVAVLFEFRWSGGELRVRNRWSSPEVAAPVEAPVEAPARAQEAIPEESRRQVERIIEEAE